MNRFKISDINNYYIFSIFVCISTTVSLTFHFNLPTYFLENTAAIKGPPQSVLGLLLPATFFDQFFVVDILKVMIIASSFLWPFFYRNRYSLLICSFSFLLLLSFQQENLFDDDHQAYLCSYIIFILSLSWFFDARKVSQTAVNNFMINSIGYKLIQFHIIAFYTFSGISKFLNSGAQWANGSYLQLIIHNNAFNRDFSHITQNPLSTRIVESNELAQFLMASAFIFELTFILSLTHRYMRILYGLTAISFHVLNNYMLEGVNYYANCILIFVFLVLDKKIFEKIVKKYTVLPIIFVLIIPFYYVLFKGRYT